LVSGTGGERQAGEPKGAATASPARAASTGTVTAFAGAAARKLDVVLRNLVLLGSADFALQGRVLVGIVAIAVIAAFAIEAGL
ncbi:hypothetical protein ACC690_38640, partial [Rhizobium johnstonii]|uniref:hypothetical protein n=1 Tax=Rhizobium johnstonii TaxID=3019933 RepID=UPI003F97D764